LHELIAKHQDSSKVDPGPKIAAALETSMRRIQDEGGVNKNAVLMMLILRASIRGWITQQEISSYHLSWLPRFAVDDMVLIYSCMFDPIHYQQNRADIVSLLALQPDPNELVRVFSLPQLLLFEWITGRSLFGEIRCLDSLVVPQLNADKSTATVSAVKSLIVRHHPGETGISGDAQRALESHGSLFELVNIVAETRGRLPRDSRHSRRLSMRFFDHRGFQRLRAGINLVLARIPTAFPRRRRLKVAVCVSGQLRGFKQAFRTWQRTLLNGVDHELFVDSWTGIGRSGAEPFRSVLPFEGANFTRAYRDVCLLTPFEEIRHRYPKLFSTLAASGNVSKAEIQSFYGTPHVRLDDDQEVPFKAWSNQQKMHAKIESSVRMARDSGVAFDLVIRIRPDQPIRGRGFSWRDLLAFCRQQPILFADHALGVHYGNLMIGDQFAISAPDVMDVYAKTWIDYPRIADEGLFQCPASFQGHATLAQVCWLHGITVRKIPMFFDALREAEPLSSLLIRDCLQVDAEGRMDPTDVLLLNSISQDVHDV